VKLRTGLENFKGAFAHGWFNIVMSSDRLSFAAAEIHKNNSTMIFLPTQGRQRREA